VDREGEVGAAAFYSGGRRVLVGHLSEGLRVWDVESRSEVGRFGDVMEYVIDLLLSPDGHRALTVSDDEFAGSAEADWRYTCET
jgi:hypothetical protein